MALVVEHTTAQGVPVTYLHITKIDLYPRDRVADVEFAGYVSEAARVAGADPVLSLPVIRLTYDELGSAEPTREQVYAAAKLLIDRRKEHVATMLQNIAARDEKTRNSPELSHSEDNLAQLQYRDLTVIFGSGPTPGELEKVNDSWIALGAIVDA